MTSLCMNMDGNDDEWNLFIIEDAGELLSADAKERSDQGLSRLLNLTDGLIGQGLRLMVLITTNEKTQGLHEAVMRPGRCLAEIAFSTFSVVEANAWLKVHDSDNLVTDIEGSQSLAQLYSRLR